MPLEHIKIQMIPYRERWNCEVGINFQKGCKTLMKCNTLTSFLCAATHMNTRTHRSLHFCNWLLCGWIILQPSIVLVNLQSTCWTLVFIFNAAGGLHCTSFWAPFCTCNSQNCSWKDWTDFSLLKLTLTDKPFAPPKSSWVVAEGWQGFQPAYQWVWT